MEWGAKKKNRGKAKGQPYLPLNGMIFITSDAFMNLFFLFFLFDEFGSLKMSINSPNAFFCRITTTAQHWNQ